MTISKQEVDQMASFMRVLNHTDNNNIISEQQQQQPGMQPSTVTTGGDTQEMKMILERFYAATGNAVTKVTKEAVHDRALREALVTERTSLGSRVGDWEIQVREDGKRKFYDVVQTDGVACIASELLLYEAAHGLVRILNSGGRVNSREAINILRAEQDYASALNEAVRYKHYLVKNPRDSRIAVFEAKYSAAKQRAINARDRVTSIAEQR